MKRGDVGRRVFLVAVLAGLLAPSARAGEIMMHQWPHVFVHEEEIPGAEIPVQMDVTYWVSAVAAPVRLKQVGPRTYEGCSSLIVRCNVNLTLSSSIIPTGAVGGDYSCSIENPDIDAPGGITKLCARLENAELGGVAGGSKGVRVAVIKITVTPR